MLVFLYEHNRISQRHNCEDQQQQRQDQTWPTSQYTVFDLKTGRITSAPASTMAGLSENPETLIKNLISHVNNTGGHLLIYIPEKCAEEITNQSAWSGGQANDNNSQIDSTNQNHVAQSASNHTNANSSSNNNNNSSQSAPTNDTQAIEPGSARCREYIPNRNRLSNNTRAIAHLADTNGHATNTNEIRYLDDQNYEESYEDFVDDEDEDPDEDEEEYPLDVPSTPLDQLNREQIIDPSDGIWQSPLEDVKFRPEESQLPIEGSIIRAPQTCVYRPKYPSREDQWPNCPGETVGKNRIQRIKSHRLKGFERMVFLVEFVEWPGEEINITARTLIKLEPKCLLKSYLNRLYLSDQHRWKHLKARWERESVGINVASFIDVASRASLTEQRETYHP